MSTKKDHGYKNPYLDQTIDRGTPVPTTLRISETRQLALAFFGVLFAIAFIVGILVLGGDVARSFALAAALLGTLSQFTAQDPNAQRASIVISYGGFLASVAAITAFTLGH
ncbi:hypothetical protein [Pararhizobium arenae]|uniref:hypothetical protein n=1 Tax=Pararhizobium arenae TaxID=1856850 RepID=UPI0009FA1681|nr:hypothetical protein [Pararhizobium arenae]